MARNMDPQNIFQMQKDNAALQQKQRSSNFAIGQGTKPVFHAATTSAVAYTEKSSSNDNKCGMNLRKANFSFGSNALSYDTTSKITNSNLDEKIKNNPTTGAQMAEKQKEQQERVWKNRIQKNFSYGRDNVNYTTDAKGSFPTQPLTQAKETFEQRTSNAALTRKTQFSFGTDVEANLIQPTRNSALLTAGQNNPNSMSGSRYQLSTAPTQQQTHPATHTNIQMGHQGIAQGPVGASRFNSSYQRANEQQEQPVNLSKLYSYNQTKSCQMRNSEMGPKHNYHVLFQASKDAASNLRKSHFTLGDTKPDYKTQSGFSHIAHNIGDTGKNNRENMKLKMQTAQFNLGSSTTKASNQTTYGKEIDNRVKENSTHGNGHEKADIDKLMTNLKNSHFKFGANKDKHTTEATTAFVAEGQTSRQYMNQVTENALLKKNMQTDNFTFKEHANGGRDHAYYVSQTKQEHRNLGNPNLIRSLIPEGQRAFNQNSRVKFGFETQHAQYAPQIPHQPLELRPITCENRKSPTNFAMPHHPASTKNQGPSKFVNQHNSANIQLGTTRNDAPKTTNQAVFRWIQPSKLPLTQKLYN